MQNIQTSYTPEFGLGAFFAGENAANTEAANQEELIKQFLDNQRERSMQPLDVEKAQLGLDPARYDAQLARAKMGDANYIPAQLAGQIGQMQSQEAAGKTAAGLQPFKQKAEQGALENQDTLQGFQWTINDLNKKISQGGDVDEAGNVVPATPNQMAFFKQKKDELTKMLAETPEYLQKDMLKDQQYAAQLAAAEARNAAMLQAAQERVAGAQAKADSESQMIARAYSTLYSANSTPEEKARADALIRQYNIDKLSRNPAAYATGLDVGAMSDKDIPKTPTPLDRAREAQGTSAPTKTINGVEYIKVPGGWKKKQ